MVKIKFKNAKKNQDATFNRISNHVVELIGPTRNQSGFDVMNKDGKLIGKYESYTYIKKRVSGGYQYTDEEETTD